MAYLQTKNKAYSTLAAELAEGTTTTFDVAAGEGANFPTENFVLTVADELILITSRATDTMTIGERGYGDTVAATHASGTQVRLNVISEIIEELQDDKLDLDQTTPQEIVNGIPTLEEIRDITGTHELVDKLYVDSAVTALGQRFYMLSTGSGVLQPVTEEEYLLTSMTASAEAESSVTATDPADDEFIAGWISPVGGAPTKLIAGTYDWDIFAAKTGGGNKVFRIYWTLVEREADDNEIVIATSAESNLLGAKAKQVIPLSLSEDYTPSAGSRIIGKVYVSLVSGSSAANVVLYSEGDSDSHWNIPTNTEVLDTIYEQVANKKTDLVDDSDTYYASQKAVKTAVDEKADIESPVFTTKIQTPTIELGDASDTTLSRSEAGKIAVEGNDVAMLDSTTVEITVADWSAGTSVTKTVSGVTATNIVWVSPVPASYAKFVEFEIKATAQGVDELTFGASETPDATINLNIVFEI